MIATINCEIENMEETISTMRFAQRCSQLENEVIFFDKIKIKILLLK
jgi:hypothetical protein